MPPRRSPTTRKQRSAFSAIGPSERKADQRAIREEREFRDFLARTGRSDTNPYGNETSFPFESANYVQPDVPGGLTREGVATLNRQAFDKFNRPFAKRSIFGRDVGGDILRGKLRSDIRPDTLTRFGRTEAAPSRGGFFSGIANLIPLIGTAMRMNKPAVLPGFGDDFVLSNLERLGPTLGTGTADNVDPEIQQSDLESFETDAGDFFREQYRFSEAPQINPDTQLAFNLSDPDGPYSLSDRVLAPGLGDQDDINFFEEFFKNKNTKQNLSGIADVASRLYGLKPLIDAPVGDNSFLTIEGRMLGGEPEGGIYFTKRLPPTR